MPARRRGSAIARTRTLLADVLSLLAVVACLPLAIIAIGMPVAIVLRLVLWLAKLL